MNISSVPAERLVLNSSDMFCTNRSAGTKYKSLIAIATHQMSRWDNKDIYKMLIRVNAAEVCDATKMPNERDDDNKIIYPGIEYYENYKPITSSRQTSN